jgi:two-component system, chemotaxis family, CheB/CheR fusion protein
MAMARKGLRLDLRTAFREAIQKNNRVIRERIAVDGDDGRVQMVTLTVESVWHAPEDDPLYLVLFSDDGPSLSRA